MPPLIVRGLVTGAESHIALVVVGGVQQVGHRVGPRRIAGGDALGLRGLEPGDLREPVPGGKLLPDIARGVAAAAHPVPHRGTPRLVHSVTMISVVQVAIGAAGGAMVAAAQGKGPVRPANAHQDAVLGGGVAVGHWARMAAGAGPVRAGGGKRPVALAVAGHAVGLGAVGSPAPLLDQGRIASLVAIQALAPA